MLVISVASGGPKVLRLRYNPLRMTESFCDGCRPPPPQNGKKKNTRNEISTKMMTNTAAMIHQIGLMPAGL